MVQAKETQSGDEPANVSHKLQIASPFSEEQAEVNRSYIWQTVL
jgi:hypothetical protein